MRGKFIGAVAIVAAALAAGAVSASAATLTVDEAAQRLCSEKAPGGADGVATYETTADELGWVRATLDGAGPGDWDLAVFGRDGRLITGSSSFGPQEVAEGIAFAGEALTVQACRQDASGAKAELDVTFRPAEQVAPGQRTSLVKVSTPSRGRKSELTSLGLDLTEHAGPDFIEVVLHSDAEAEKLRRAGFTFVTEVADLVAQAAGQRASERAYARRLQARGLQARGIPSGRTGYRTGVEYQEDLKKLVAENPGLVKPITLANKTLSGRTVEGIEITEDVDARDGKPVFFNMGIHHAREWPSGEHAMEWAIDIVNAYKANDARTRTLLGRARVIVVPVINPDGFSVSRGAASAMEDGREGQDEIANLAAFPNEFHRKNCRVGTTETANCNATGNGIAQIGSDPNRNYGGFWGGPGASTQPQAQDYRGPGPFSEAETRNVQDLVSKRQVTTLITNHTFSDLILRPPGIAAKGFTPDDGIYKELGATMAAENGYLNQASFELYDTTGGTEDWTYYTTGGLGFTFEIGCDTFQAGAQGSCGDGHFHPAYQKMVAEYEGTTDRSDAGGRDGGGNREAYYKALEHTADASKHAVIEGTAPPGAILRITKAFKTRTSPVIDASGTPGDVREFDDKLESTIVVPASGRYEWHMNQSTRPVTVGKGRQPTGPPSAAQSFTGGPDPLEARPCGDAETTDPACWNDHPITVPNDSSKDNESVVVKAEWGPTGVSDWDMKVFRDSNGDGSSVGETALVGSSAQAPGTPEQVTIPSVRPDEKYVVRMINYSAVESYDGAIQFIGPDFTPSGGPESWTLTCEQAEGNPLSTQDLFINRGERRTVDLPGCQRATSAGAGTGAGTGSGTGTGAGAGAGGATGLVPGPGAATTGRCVVSRGRLALRKGRVRTKLRCATATRGTLILSTKQKVRRKTRTVRLAAKRFNVPAGRTQKIAVKVNRRGLRVLRRKRSTKVTLTASVVGATRTRANTTVKR